MHILINSIYHISAYYGGNEHYLHHLSLGLIDAGHQVTYITGQSQQPANYPYPIITTPVYHLFGKPIPSLSWQRQITALHPDLLHASGSGIPLIPAALWLRHQQHLPTILTYQAPTNPDNFILKAAAHLETQSIPHAFSGIIATGPQNYQLLKQRWPKSQIKFIPMMLAPHFMQPSQSQVHARKQLDLPLDRHIILFVGQLDAHHYYKAFPDIIQAAISLPDDYLILVVGEGNLKIQFQNQINQLGLTSKFKFVGFIENTQITPYFYASDCFILPSNSSSEGFGLVLLEAMACGLPTITTTAIGSASWLKEHDVTTLISPRQPELLASAIKQQINHPDLTKIAKSKKFARSFTTKRMIKTTLNFYEELINSTQ